MGTNHSSSKKDKNKSGKNLKDENISTKLVQVRIQIKSNIWEKAFNVEETLENVAKNFKSENDMDTINKNYFIEWTFNNSPIEMNSIKLEQFILDHNIKEGNPIEICQKIKVNKNNFNILEICEIVGKPLFSPFEIIIFNVVQKKIKIKTYNNRYIVQNELDKYSIESSYCNGNNLLFISGGLDPSSNSPLELFWEIDLKTDNLNNPIKMGIQKKNHSMIYADKKVFIIGGNNENCLFYDIGKQTINNFGNLNKNRFEPSLIKHDNYIFCFDSTKQQDDDRFSLEKIDLDNLANPTWEIIYPNISPLIGKNVYSQKFFGVVEDYKQNIIFLGGIYDNIKGFGSPNNSEKMNARYNISKNIIEQSDIPFKEISLSEKTFLPLDDKTFFILPNFSKRSPKIIYYNRDKNDINISSYASSSILKKKKNYKINPNTQIMASLSGLNFNMPGLNNDNDLNIITPNINNDMALNNQNIFKNGNYVNNLDFTSKQNDNILEIDNNFNTNINDNNNNINQKINIESNINPNIGVTIKPNINNDINQNHSNNIELDGPNMNINAKIDLNGNKNTNLGLSNSDNNEIKPKIDQNDNNINNKTEINNPDDIKIEILKSTDQNEKVHKIEYIPVTDRYYIEPKIGFHNSVDDPCNYIKKIKIKNQPYPDPLPVKLIKYKAKEILKEEKKKFGFYNY